MQINTLVLGELETNTYFLEIDNELLIVDPASDFDIIRHHIGNKKLLGVLLTHHHFDHIGALEETLSYYDVPLYDFNNFHDEVSIGKFKFKMLKTLGHTMDSVTFYFEEDKAMFVGDFIFRGSIGRTDLGGDPKLMEESIKFIKNYSGVTLYPGHGDETELDFEKQNNIYLQ